jgi:hypothetical protein
MRAVGFALTGSDNANPKVIGDRASCVFAVKNELFRLNNVYTDRIKIQGRQRQSFGVLEQWVTVTLQGDDIVFGETIEPPKDDGSEFMRQMRVQSPSMFEPHHYSYTQQELYLATNDQDGVKAAWQYVYSHGCTGKPPPRPCREAALTRHRAASPLGAALTRPGETRQTSPDCWSRGS